MIYNAEKGDFRMVLTGDTMLSRRLKPCNEPRFLGIRDLMVGADVVFTNLEATVCTPDEGAHDFSVGTLMSTPPALLGELQWMGVNLVSCANNHATDFGQQGLLATRVHLERAGLACSGSGENLDRAREPAYLDTPNGRVALISANAFFSPHHRAAPQGGTVRGRPGINPLAYDTLHTVDSSAYEQLLLMSRELGLEQEAKRRKRHFFAAAEIGGGSDADQMVFLGNRFARGNGYAVTTSADPDDREANLRWIREARRQADWVIVSLHCHAFAFRDARTANTSADRQELADFAREFCRSAVDSGADAVVCHGPHISLGLEIYRGKPVFYSLGNFIFQNDTVTQVPRESFQRFGLGPDATPADFFETRTGQETKGFPAHPEFWRSILGVCTFRKGKLAGVEIHPLDLGYGLPRAQRGRPVLAQGKVAREILERTEALSVFYGTQFVTGKDFATVKLGDSAPLEGGE